MIVGYHDKEEHVIKKLGEIRLEAHYLNHEPDTRHLPLRIDFGAASKLLSRQRYANGDVIRSIEDQRCLVVRGTDSETFDALDWDPAGISFTGSESGRSMAF